MKKLRILSIVCLVALVPLFSACEKDLVDNKGNGVSNPKPDDAIGGDNAIDKAQVKIINAIDSEVSGAISIKLGGVDILNDLPLMGVSDLIPLDAGEFNLEVLSADNSVLISSKLILVEKQVYNIVIGSSADGLPSLDVLESLPVTGALSDPLGLVLGLNLLPEDLSTLEILNLSDVNAENILLALDYIDAQGDVVGGLMSLPDNVLSNPIIVNNDILSKISLLSSAVSLDDLLGDLSAENDLLEIVDLNGITGLLNLGESGPEGILETLNGILSGLLGNILGFGGENPLDLLDAGILNELPVDLPADYTLIILGDEESFDYILVDGGLPGLPALP